MHCTCENVEVGSYGNQVAVPAPAHMLGKSFGCHQIRDMICLDRCIADEVQRLWALGITTLACCCGHGVVPAYIQTAIDDAQRMLDMGYVSLGLEACCFEPRRRRDGR